MARKSKYQPGVNAEEKYFTISTRKLNLVFLISISLVILTYMIFLPPKRYGDGNEYFLILESLSNHFTPDLQVKDIDSFYNGNLNAFDEAINPYSGYFQSKSGKYYSYHFWSYPLLNVPIKVWLETFNIDTRRTFQLTNAFLFIAMLTAITFFSNFSQGQKLVFIILITLSPALWYIHWTHPEIFSFVFVALAIVFMNKGDYGIAIICAGIASLQNQPIVLFVLFLLIKGVLLKARLKNFLKLALLSSIIFVPNIFYFMNYGSFSLLNKAISMNNVSIYRIFEMFFDMNIGLFPYVPVTLLLFFGITFWGLYRERKFTLELQVLILIVLMMTVCAMTFNWNHGDSVPSRYLIWMIPFIFYIITRNLDDLLRSKVLRGVLIIGIIVQLIIVNRAGPFIPKISYIEHSPAARMMLNYFPKLYNPSHEIFCERTLHGERPCIDPTIYEYKTTCKTALSTCEGLHRLEDQCGPITPKIKRQCESENKPNGWFYVNF